MKNLIKITQQNGQKAVSARELHQFLGVQTRFNDWISRRIEEYGFIENQDFILITQNWETKKGQGGDRRSKEYALSLDMAKELSMVEKTKKGKQARCYFIEVEKQAQALAFELPAPRTINGVQCVSYTGWLLKNGYSLTSGQVLGRIKKYPEQFMKLSQGWYMSEAIGQYFLDFRNAKQRVEALPMVSPKQLCLFDN